MATGDGRERPGEAAALEEERRYEALREAFWQEASIEGLTLAAYVERALAGGADAGALGRLLRLVEDVEDTVLKNIALKAEEEGGMYEALAEERMAEVQAERAELVDRLRAAGA